MDIARLYRDAQRSFVDVVRACDAGDLERPSPCTPGWTARDLLSHVAGVSIDIAAGNVEGAATEPWTAAQVERWRDTPVDELVARWDETIDQAAEAIEMFGERRPPLDCHTHEHDLRTAIDRPGNRDSEMIEVAANLFLEGSVGPPLAIHFEDGTDVVMDGQGDVLELESISRFEFVRSRLGRRTRAQVESWAWSRPPGDDVFSEWFVFGPAAATIVE